MTDVVDYSLLFDRDHKRHLRLAYDPTERQPWRIRDALSADQLYAHASTLKQAVSFMRAAERKGHATVDEVSVAHHSRLADPAEWESLWRSYQRVLEADGHSVRVPDAPLADVLQFRPRMLEPTDEVGA